MTVIIAKTALTPQGWQQDCRVEIANGEIVNVTPQAADSSDDDAVRVDILLPAPGNIHSHAFQRAMAGLTEARGKRADGARDDFWRWRRLMYHFLEHLTPDNIRAIAALVQIEMLEAGYGSCGEFHYLHHGKDGACYDNLAEMSVQIMQAAKQSGIGLTLLPVLYQQAGCDGRALQGGQKRFGNNLDRFEKLLADAEAYLPQMPQDTIIGVAPHSLRAVSQEALKAAVNLRPQAPFHIHLAEQTGEVEEVLAAWGARPAAWLLDNAPVDARWCLIHATQIEAAEIESLAKSGAVAGLCPITESNLGDGIFPGVEFLAHGGRFAVGSDSNIRIALDEELRVLEYSQRLRDKSRAALAGESASTGRVLYDHACGGGAQSLGRRSGVIAPGRLADLLSLNGAHPDLAGLQGDAILDSWIFTGGNHLTEHVWAAGRHCVINGRHHARDEIVKDYSAAVAGLRQSFQS